MILQQSILMNLCKVLNHYLSTEMKRKMKDKLKHSLIKWFNSCNNIIRNNNNSKWCSRYLMAKSIWFRRWRTWKTWMKNNFSKCKLLLLHKWKLKIMKICNLMTMMMISKIIKIQSKEWLICLQTGVINRIKTMKRIKMIIIKIIESIVFNVNH